MNKIKINKEVFALLNTTKISIDYWKAGVEIGTNNGNYKAATIFNADRTIKYYVESDFAFCAKCASFNCKAGIGTNGNRVECSEDETIPWDTWRQIEEPIHADFNYDVEYWKPTDEENGEWVQILSIRNKE